MTLPIRFCSVLVLVIQLTAAAAALGQCPGDCDDNGEVAVNELVQAVRIALEQATVAACPNVDTNHDGAVSIAELVVAVTRLLNGCIPAGATPTPTSEPPPTSTPDPSLPPTNQTDLIAWLQAGHYLGWPAEGGRHPGSGPHFGAVRTFLNDVLFASLDDETTPHPARAAAVKELFGAGTQVRGWAVAIKPADGEDGTAWYWFEYYDGRPLAGGFGNPACIGCHGGGTDFICSPFPLQPGGQTIPARCP